MQPRYKQQSRQYEELQTILYEQRSKNDTVRTIPVAIEACQSPNCR